MSKSGFALIAANLPQTFKQWRVTYWGQNSKEVCVTLADSRQQALELSGIQRDRIISVERSLKFLWSRSGTGNLAAANNQLLFLVQFSAALATCRGRGINDLINANPEFKKIATKHPEALRDDLSFSAKLSLLRFSKPVIAIVKAGEKTGRVKECVDEAARYLQLQLDVEKASSQHVMLSSLLLCASLGAFFALPHFVSEPLKSLESFDEIHLPITWATEVLFFVNSLTGERLAFFFATFFALALLAWRHRQIISTVYPFKYFKNLANCSRSLRLLLIWRPYRLTGMPLERDSEALNAALGTNVGTQLLQALRRGASLCHELNEKYFSLSLVAASGELANANAADFVRISEALLFSLGEERRLLAEKLAAAFYLTSLAIAMGTIMLVAIGLIYPILGATTAVDI